MSNLSKIIKLKFPDVDLMNNVRLQDDGQGAYIKQWDPSLGKKPTQADLAQWETDLAGAMVLEDNKILNKEAYNKLNEIDMKSIRALREKDTNYLATLTAQAVDLRATLKPVS